MTSPSDVQVRASLEDELTGPLEDVRRQVRRTAEDVDDAGKKANRGARGFDVMAGSAVRMGGAFGRIAFRGVAAGLGIVSVAAVATGAKLVGLAMDAAETASKFGTVFAGVPGDVGGYLDDLSSRFGLVTKDLQDAAANFGVFGKAAGIPRDALGAFSKDLVGAGTDLASFYNADPTDVFQALRSGLSGEAEPLRQFGIFLSDAAMKAEAATMGLTGELTESQKVMVRQRIIMASLGDAQGDLERTSGGLSNQWKALKGNLTNAGTAIGTALLPYATQLVTAVNDRLGPATDRLNASLPMMTAHLEAAGAKAASVVSAFQGGGLDAGVAQLDAATGAGGRLEGAFALVEPIVRDLATVARDVLAPAIGDVSGAIDPAWLTPLGAVRLMLGLVAGNADVFRFAVTGVIGVLTIAKAVTLAHAAATGVMGAAAVVNGVRIGVLTGATVVQTGAERLSTAATYQNTAAKVRNTAVTVASRTATLLAAGASKAWAAAQWLLNAALSANPIGLVVVGVAALAGGIYLAYQRSSTFRGAVQGLVEKLKDLWTWAKKAGSAAKDALSFDVSLPSIGNPFGDTATSKARGGGIASTLASHASIVGAAGVSPRIANAFVGGGGRGPGSGDHQRGQALDLVGPGLGAYARETRRQGGYAAFHGSGRTRHLHAVPAPIGDTRTSMASRVAARRTSAQTVAAAPAPRVVIGPGAIIVQGLTAEDAADAVAAGIEAWVRDSEERS